MGTDRPLPTEGGTGRFVVVLSDVHLGTDSPTVWYQRSHHEPGLVHLLDWVAANAGAIRELVLLGDIVDLWTYPADEVPATFAAIAATHPAVFGPDGALARVLDALDGAVTYVTGNHDMGLTAAEVATVVSPGGHHLRLSVDHPYHPGGDTRLACTHGHDFTLFNAPHLRTPWAPLPVGHFITRAVSTAWQRRLGPGATVADLPGQGAPNGLDLSSLTTVAGGLSSWSITAAVVDFVSGATGFGLDEPIVVPDGSSTTLAEVRTAYADCWTDWAADHGGGLVGAASAYRAALADLDGSYLGWFAQQLALASDTELVVMGHTHRPISGLEDSPIRYVNTGFDCPSEPDRQLGPAMQRATFAVIDAVDLEAAIWEVAQVADGGDPVCRPTSVPGARVVGSAGRDFSCYVTVDNRDGDGPLELVASGTTYGYFASAPPERVAAGEQGRFWVQDSLGPSGSDGWATYARGDETWTLRATCPTLGANGAWGTPEIRTRASSGEWRDGEATRRGHPLFVHFRCPPA